MTTTAWRLHSLGLVVKNDRARTLAESKLSDPKQEVRAAAISAIAKRGDPSLASAVVPKLDDENATVRFNAAAAVVHLADQPRRR